MAKILIPALNADEWQRFLAHPEKQWARGYSARALAYCWHDAPEGLPARVRAVLEQHPALRGIEAMLVLPEHQVPLPGGARPSQSDIWVLARTPEALVSVTIEGKVEEDFGPTMGEWLKGASAGKCERLTYLCSELGLGDAPPKEIRYQLVHRAAAAVIEARRFRARHAVMLVHSFSPSHEHLDDYRGFLRLFGAAGEVDRLVTVRADPALSLHLGWVHGDPKYLSA